MNTAYDCVVIGGGPAGSTAAAIVAGARFSTLLLERDPMPRFHVGESLMPDTYWVLSRLGILDKVRSHAFVKKVGVQFVNPEGTKSQPFYFMEHDPRECSQTWHVERAEFDRILFENAARHGAECLDRNRVVDVELDATPPRVAFRGEQGTVREVTARVVVDATGQQSLLANRLGLRVPNPQLRKAAIWGHFRNAKRNPESDVEVTTILHGRGKQVWFWYIPLSDNKVSVGLVSDNDRLLRRSQSPQAVFDEEAAACPGLADRLTSATIVDRLLVAKEFSYSTSRHAGDGWVLVGDAFGFIDPIYSTGALLAFKSAEMAADAIVEGLRSGDTSARQLGKWTPDFEIGLERFRTLVRAFYTPEFSFAEFVRRFPQHKSSLTDLLIGRAFTPDADRLFTDLVPALAGAA